MIPNMITSIGSLRGVGMSTVDDQEALESKLMMAARSDPQQFTPIYEQYAPRLYAYCLRRLGVASEAEELTSIIFTRALGNIEQYHGGLVSAWLFRIAHNVVYDYYHGRQTNVPLDEIQDTAEAAAPSPIEYVIQTEEARLLRDLVNQLPAEQRELLLLKIVDGLSSERIGTLLGKSSGSVRVTLHRIIRQLHAQYRQHEGDETHEPAK